MDKIEVDRETLERARLAVAALLNMNENAGNPLKLTCNNVGERARDELRALLTPPPARDEWRQRAATYCDDDELASGLDATMGDDFRDLHDTLAATLREELRLAHSAKDEYRKRVIQQDERADALRAEKAKLAERVSYYRFEWEQACERVKAAQFAEGEARARVEELEGEDEEREQAKALEHGETIDALDKANTQAAIDKEQIAGDAETIRGLRAVLEPVASYYDQNPGGYLVKFCDQIRNLRAAIAPTPPSSDAPQAGETGAGIACEHFRQDYMPGICPTERGKRLAARIDSAMAALRAELEQANRPRCDCGGSRHEGYEGQARALRAEVERLRGALLDAISDVDDIRDDRDINDSWAGPWARETGDKFRTALAPAPPAPDAQQEQ